VELGQRGYFPFASSTENRVDRAGVRFEWQAVVRMDPVVIEDIELALVDARAALAEEDGEGKGTGKGSYGAWTEGTRDEGGEEGGGGGVTSGTGSGTGSETSSGGEDDDDDDDDSGGNSTSDTDTGDIGTNAGAAAKDGAAKIDANKVPDAHKKNRGGGAARERGRARRRVEGNTGSVKETESKVQKVQRPQRATVAMSEPTSSLAASMAGFAGAAATCKGTSRGGENEDGDSIPQELLCPIGKQVRGGNRGRAQ
jgi:hypothetical protein